MTPYGDAAISWRIEDDRLVVDVRVPVGATGILELPGPPPRPSRTASIDRETAVMLAVG